MANSSKAEDILMQKHIKSTATKPLSISPNAWGNFFRHIDSLYPSKSMEWVKGVAWTPFFYSCLKDICTGTYTAALVQKRSNGILFDNKYITFEIHLWNNEDLQAKPKTKHTFLISWMLIDPHY